MIVERQQLHFLKVRSLRNFKSFIFLQGLVILEFQKHIFVRVEASQIAKAFIFVRFGDSRASIVLFYVRLRDFGWWQLHPPLPLRLIPRHIRKAL